MNKHFNPAISEEKFAAWLDGMLPADEMQEVSHEIEKDTSLQHISDVCSVVDESMNRISDVSPILMEDLKSGDFELPNIENVDFLNSHGDSFSLEENLYGKDSMKEDDFHEYNIESINAKTNMGTLKQTIGDLEPFPGADTTAVHQIYNDTCAIKSQQIVLTSFGYDIPEDQLVQEAMALNIYEPGSGTSPHDVGILLNAHGVPTHAVQNAHVYDLVNELAQGHKVIVGVDSGELWHPSVFEKIQDLFGGQADHALLVTGIDTTDPNNIEVIITDPGSGDVAMRYPMEQFLDAWHDSHCLMVATDIPAPAEHDPAMVNFDYGEGHISFIGDVPFDVFSGVMLPEINQYFDANQLFGNEDGNTSIFDHVFSAFSNYDVDGGIDFMDLL